MLRHGGHRYSLEEVGFAFIIPVPWSTQSRTYWHTHAELTHSHDHGRDAEGQEHGNGAHVHNHAAPSRGLTPGPGFPRTRRNGQPSLPAPPLDVRIARAPPQGSTGPAH